MQSNRPQRRRRRNLEDQEQITTIGWLDLQYPGFAQCTFHVPNGGKRGKAEAGIFKAMGVRRGVSDLVSLFPAGQFHGLIVEMKAARPDDSIVTDEQKEFLDLMASMGFRAEVCRGFVEAQRVYKDYLRNDVARARRRTEPRVRGR